MKILRPSRSSVLRLAPALLSAAMGMLLSASAHAQVARSVPDSMDAWRTSLLERLDQDLAELNTGEKSGLRAREVVSYPQANISAPAMRLLPPQMPGRRQPWLPEVATALREHGLPADFIGIAAVESGLNPSALSPKGARGLWQLMPATARRYGLAVEAGRDERLDPLKSTLAAARYLKDLYGQFQDWPLALAAYNAGENRVQRSLDRLGAQDFWTLNRLAALPEETRQYVPAVLERIGPAFSNSNPAPSAGSGARAVDLGVFSRQARRTVYAAPSAYL